MFYTILPGEGLALPRRNKLKSKGINPATATLNRITKSLQITALEEIVNILATCQDLNISPKVLIHSSRRIKDSLTEKRH